MCETIQPPPSQVWQGDVGIIARRREQRKRLHVDIRGVVLACQGVRTHCVSKGVDDEVGIPAGCFRLAPDIRADPNRVIHHFAKQPDEILSRVIETTAQLLRVASQRHEFDPLFFDEPPKPAWRSQFYDVTVFHQPKR